MKGGGGLYAIFTLTQIDWGEILFKSHRQMVIDKEILHCFAMRVNSLGFIRFFFQGLSTVASTAAFDKVDLLLYCIEEELFYLMNGPRIISIIRLPI